LQCGDKLTLRLIWDVWSLYAYPNIAKITSRRRIITFLI